MEGSELVILGLLGEEEMHVYKILEVLEGNLHFVSDLKRATAYRVLERLYGRGLVEREVTREGHYPERIVYRLTEAGRSRLLQLLRQALGSMDGVLSRGNAALTFADRLEPAERVELLGLRRQVVERQRAHVDVLIATHQPGTSARLVLEHEMAYVEAELAWLERTIPTIR